MAITNLLKKFLRVLTSIVLVIMLLCCIYVLTHEVRVFYALNTENFLKLRLLGPCYTGAELGGMRYLARKDNKIYQVCVVRRLTEKYTLTEIHYIGEIRY